MLHILILTAVLGLVVIITVALENFLRVTIPLPKYCMILIVTSHLDKGLAELESK